jgi:hypothetical protein
MSLFFNLCKALGIVIIAHVLFYVGMWVMIDIFPDIRDIGFFGPIGNAFYIEGEFGPFLIIPVLLASGALCLPPKGRWYAAIGALLLILGAVIWYGNYLEICVRAVPH